MRCRRWGEPKKSSPGGGGGSEVPTRGCGSNTAWPRRGRMRHATQGAAVGVERAPIADLAVRPPNRMAGAGRWHEINTSSPNEGEGR